MLKAKLSGLNRFALGILVLVALLLAVWPLPGVVALRYGIAAFLLITLLSRAIQQKQLLQDLRMSGSAGMALAWLTIWITVQALIISPFPEKAFSEITGQWLKAVLFFVMGLMAAAESSRIDQGKWRVTAVAVAFSVFAAQVLVLLADDLYLYMTQGFVPYHWSRITGGHKAAMSNICSFFMLMLAADIGSRLSIGKRLLPIAPWAIAVLIGFGLLATWILSARNGVISLVVIVVTTIGLTLWIRRITWQKTLALCLGVAVMISGFALLTYKSDVRWQKFSQSVQKGLAIDEYAAWIKPAKYPYPKMANGEQVDVSAYERSAWLKSGVGFAKAHPLGIGYDRGAYGRARFLAYGEDAREGMGDHSHSSVIDLAIGIGIPGVLLWLTFLCALVGVGSKSLRQSHQPAGLVLTLVAMVYMVGAFVDSNVRDHMLEEFMFLSAVFLVLARPSEKGWSHE